MATGPDDTDDGPSSASERLARLREAESLADLVDLTGAATEHDAYFAAKHEWSELMERCEDTSPVDGLPGNCVVVDGHEFHVHGVTHADTGAERSFLRDHVGGFVDRGATVYCEQGIRPMYFADIGGVCAMDDYRWAMRRCEELDLDSRVAGLAGSFDGLLEDLDTLSAEFRDAVFSLVDSGGEFYGDDFRRTLGAVASEFLMSHEDAATGDHFEAFAHSREAAEDPSKLADLQRYYRRTFLPQPVEREWLRRHDRELEVMTHARNERMADYAVHHNRDAEEVHLVVGAAHQPGVVYYLERHRDGRRDADGFEYVD